MADKTNKSELKLVRKEGSNEYHTEDFIVDEPNAPLIPEGVYTASYTHHETATIWTAKVFVWFRLVELGPHQGVMLYRPYRAKELLGPAGRNGHFRLHQRSELYLALCRLSESRYIRPDRISLRMLKRVLLRVTVRTVLKDYKQRPLPALSHYSVVDKLLDVEVGDIK